MQRFLEATHEMFEGGDDVPVYRPQPRSESTPAIEDVNEPQATPVAGCVRRYVTAVLTDNGETSRKTLYSVRASSTPPSSGVSVVHSLRETSPEIICLGTQRAVATTGY